VIMGIQRRLSLRVLSVGRWAGTLALVLAVCLVAGGVMQVNADQPPAPPEQPHYFYGSVTSNGSPVPEGTPVEAYVDGVKKAETTVGPGGEYGYVPTFGVTGTAGAEVTFRVGGVPAIETAVWQFGKVQQLDLTIEVDAEADIQIEKSASVPPCTDVQAGTEVVYTFVVTNTGDLTLTGVTLSDPMFTGDDAPSFVSSSKGSSPGSLLPGESATYQAEYTITVDDIEAGDDIVNVAVVTCDQGVSDEDSATVKLKFAADFVEMQAGWNLISLPLIPDEPVIETVLADILDDVISVHHYDADADEWLVFVPETLSNLETMVDGKAYWIEMAAAAMLEVEGQWLPDPPAMPPAYAVVPGWNMVGFKSTSEMAASIYLDGTTYVRIYGFENGLWYTIPSPYVGAMVPGQGYWVAFVEAGAIYP